MASATVASNEASSFVYEHLINHVQLIHSQIVQLFVLLDEKIKSGTFKTTELKHRSFTFTDLFGNATVAECMAHDYLNHVINKYKKEYIPRYLTSWIHFGTQTRHDITELSDRDLQSTVSDFSNDPSFVTYGELIVWFGTYVDSNPEKLILKVSLGDGVKKIISTIAKRRCFTNIELKSFIINENVKPCETDWNQAKLLSSEDTVMSGRLYEDKCVVLAKYTLEESDSNDTNYGFIVFLRTLTGKAITMRVNATMTIQTFKQLIEKVEGAPSDYQRIIFSGKQLEDRKTIGDYNIKPESTMNLVLSLRGGMYHFTSGRQDFKNLSQRSASAIKDVLEFELRDINDENVLSLTELQDSLLEAQSVLSTLYSSIKDVYTPQDLPDLKKIMLTFNEDTKLENKDDS